VPVKTSSVRGGAASGFTLEPPRVRKPPTSTRGWNTGGAPTLAKATQGAAVTSRLLDEVRAARLNDGATVTPVGAGARDGGVAKPKKVAPKKDKAPPPPPPPSPPKKLPGPPSAKKKATAKFIKKSMREMQAGRAGRPS